MRPTGKSFRFVSCVRAVCMSSQIGEKKHRGTFPFSLFFSLPFPFSLPGWPTGWYLDVQKHGFVTDSDPHGSKSGSEGIPWQLFSRQIFWEEPNPAMMSKMDRNIKGFGSGFSDFSDFPQMENRGLRWIALGLGSPKTLFSAKKPWFSDYFWQFPIIWGFPLGPLLAPIGSI